MMTLDNDKPKVTLEQLLRVKRAEQPAPEFWAQFDRELREKQLAAIVEPRPWWAPFIRVGSKLARYQMPIGATAVVALTLLTVRQYEAAAPGSGTPVAMPSQQLAEHARENAGSGGAAAVATAEPRRKAEARLRAASTAAASASIREKAPAQILASSDVAADRGSLGAEALLGGAEQREESQSRASDSVASRMVATNLEIVQNSEPGLLPLGLHHVSGLKIASAQSTALYATDSELMEEPLAQSGAEVAQRRSSRLLAGALPASETAELASASVRSATLRLNRSISEQRLYDSMRRGGLSGERVAIKF